LKRIVLYAFMAGALVAAVLLALPPNEVEVFYLDSAGNQVGYYFRGCDGARLREGTVTNTTITMSSSCSGGGCSGTGMTCILDGMTISCSSQVFVHECTVNALPCGGC